MSDNMSNFDDLLEPLRYNNLSNFLLTDVRTIGGGVFVEEDSLEHLRILDLVVKGYQSIHVPTFGHVIPNTQSIESGNISSVTNTKFIQPTNGQVIEVQALDMLSNASGTAIRVYLGDANTGGKVLLYDGTSGALPSGTTVSFNSIVPVFLPLKIAFGQELIIETLSSGSVDLDVQAMTIKRQQ
jgi:hypothetical protein